MKNWKKLLCISLVITLTGCSAAPSEGGNKTAMYQKNISKIALYQSNLPDDYQILDFRQKALEIDRLLYDQEAQGQYLPLIWEDQTYRTFGIPAYVGDGRMGRDGEEEAVTVIAGVLSASLLGVDKSRGINYVEALGAFYSQEEHIILNNPSGRSDTTSMWYLLYPAILFTQVSILYPEEAQIREQALECIESWYQAYLRMKETGTFDYTGFNFTTGEPYRNQVWTEPDSAAGIAMLLYYGYELTGKEAYLEGSKSSLAYLKDYFGSSLYEVLLYFSPYLAALFNMQFDGEYQVEDMLNDTFSGSSIPRGGWGSINGTWGSVNVDGLMGSTTDGGGYAFAMNSFAAAYALSPVAKYDTRYASALGKWYLHIISNSRLFFPDQVPTDNQSAFLTEEGRRFMEENNSLIPYEGIRKSYNSKTPWFGGDPTVYGWGETDFSLYSGMHTGLLAAIFEETNVAGILKIDLNKADYFNQDYPAYLLYNPYQEEKQVEYQVASKDRVSLFDSVTKQVIAEDVSGSCQLTIKPGDSLVIIELPPGAEIIHTGTKYLINNTIFAVDGMSAAVLNYENNDVVSGRFTLELGVAGTVLADQIKEVIVKTAEQETIYHNLNDITFNSKELGEGSRTFQITVVMESGLKDSIQLRLNIK